MLDVGPAVSTPVTNMKKAQHMQSRSSARWREAVGFIAGGTGHCRVLCRGHSTGHELKRTVSEQHELDII